MLQLRRDQPLIDALNAIVEKHSRWGFWKCYHRLRNEGHQWNHKRLWRVYYSMNLNHKRRTKKRIPQRVRQSLEVQTVANDTWALYFMSDALYSGMRYRVLNVLDEGVRELLDVTVDTSLPAQRVVRVLEQLKDQRGLPRAIRLDNGPEFISSTLIRWCEAHGAQMMHIQPGKPNQNAFVERFNRSFRDELLDAHLFTSLEQVREMSWVWMISYNEERPHESLGNIPPSEFRRPVTAESLEMN